MFKDEEIIEIKNCKNCNSSFEITDKDLEFYEKVSPSFNGKKYLIPSPTFCPRCREQRRMSFFNQTNLYKNNCNSC
jgi:Zn ribbon nucleic-acid-binding protein